MFSAVPTELKIAETLTCSTRRRFSLTVLHECLVTMPHEDVVYLGDNARLPYGSRPLDEITRFALEIGGWLEVQDVKLVVAACNSATAAALPDLQLRLSVPVVGVLAPE